MDKKPTRAKLSFTKPTTKMARVLALVEQGVVDRWVMADQLDLTVEQVTSALYNLRFRGEIETVAHTSAGRHKGRSDTIYKVKGADLKLPPDVVRPSPMSGVSFIFHAGSK